MSSQEQGDNGQTVSERESVRDDSTREEEVSPSSRASSSLDYVYLYTSPIDNSDMAYYVGLVLITLASIATRLYSISEPQHVA